MRLQRLPQQWLYVRIRAGSSALQIEGVVNGLNSIVAETDGTEVVNLQDFLSQTEFASEMIMLFFYVGTFYF